MYRTLPYFIETFDTVIVKLQFITNGKINSTNKAF